MLLNAFSFGRGIRVAHRFLFCERDPCCSSFLVLGRGSVLLIVFGFGTGIRVAHRFCFGRGIRVALLFLFWEADLCCGGGGEGIRAAHCCFF